MKTLNLFRKAAVAIVAIPLLAGCDANIGVKGLDSGSSQQSSNSGPGPDGGCNPPMQGPGGQNQGQGGPNQGPQNMAMGGPNQGPNQGPPNQGGRGQGNGMQPCMVNGGPGQQGPNQGLNQGPPNQNRAPNQNNAPGVNALNPQFSDAPFTGKPVILVIDPAKTYEVVDQFGNVREPGPAPFQEGDTLRETNRTLTALEAAYTQVFIIMNPIRNALMYAPKSVDSIEWNDMTAPLAEYHIASTDILAQAQQGGHNAAIRKYMADSELTLKCYLFSETGESIDLSGPDGRDYCHDVLGIRTKF